MTKYDHFIRLIALGGFIIAGLILTTLLSGLLLILDGYSLQEIQEMGQYGGVSLSTSVTRILLICQHLLIFILPALIAGFIFYRSKIWNGLLLNQSPGWNLTLLSLFFLLAGYPLVNLSFMVNETLPLPDWALLLEDQARDTLEAILTMETPWIFLLNLIIIAILPGIGEELIFRGLIQKELQSIFKSPIAAIWVTGFLFSAIHFQFEGFLPRMVLGVILGYLYHWTQNLWVPIIAHAVNNGMQVILLYVTDMEIDDVEQQGSGQLTWWMLPLSIGLMYWLALRIHKNRKPLEQT
jgi:membrane protease YdiL (CAAX protease family)